MITTRDLVVAVHACGRLTDVVLDHAPAEMPWGLTEMTLRDPDGNVIRVAQPTGCQT